MIFICEVLGGAAWLKEERLLGVEGKVECLWSNPTSVRISLLSGPQRHGKKLCYKQPLLLRVTLMVEPFSAWPQETVSIQTVSHSKPSFL